MRLSFDLFRLSTYVATGLAFVLFGSSARGATPPQNASLFSIAKSENKNQVQYAVHLNAQCAPASAAPVFVYWRLLEQGSRVAPLLEREQSAYGIASQRLEGPNRIRLVLRAVPSRPIIVETGRTDGGACRAVANMVIGGAPAYLFNVYLKLKWPMSVDYLLLRGWSHDRSHVVSEKLRL